MKNRILWLLALAVSACQSNSPAPSMDFNEHVLKSLKEMPQGGGYSIRPPAHHGLVKSVSMDGNAYKVDPEKASPSFCSGATYLVFLKALQKATKPTQSSKLLITGQDDGVGVWGRWNSNGPGTARLVHELGLGRNFQDWSEARPGDFLKIFWNDEIGKHERGHSVIFLGEEMVNGVPHVRFWSSNQPDGMGEKSVEKTKIRRAIFSRIEHPERIENVRTLPEKDDYLAEMLTRPSSPEEMAKMSGLP